MPRKDLTREEVLAGLKAPALVAVDDLVDDAGLPRPWGYRGTEEFAFAVDPRTLDRDYRHLLISSGVGVPWQGRRWRFDRAWPELLVAFEYEGNVGSRNWAKVDHTRPERYESDCEKYSAAACLGWTLVRATPAMMEDGRGLLLLRAALVRGELRVSRDRALSRLSSDPGRGFGV